MRSAAIRHLEMIKRAANHQIASQNIGWVMADKTLDK
jgi:hypothetical protein